MTENFIGFLNEKKIYPEYEYKSEGPDHLKKFVASCQYDGRYFKGELCSKKKEATKSCAGKVADYYRMKQNSSRNSSSSFVSETYDNASSSSNSINDSPISASAAASNGSSINLTIENPGSSVNGISARMAKEFGVAEKCNSFLKLEIKPLSEADDKELYEMTGIRQRNGFLQRNFNDSKIYLGEGSFGCILKAEKRDDEIFYAVKLIHIDIAIEEKINLARREVQAISRCQHPNIVQYYDFWFEMSKNGRYFSGIMFIQMELCKRSLKDWLLKEENFPHLPEPQKRIFFDLSHALDYIHNEQKIIHRDIKPANILISQFHNSNGYIKVKLGDFGLSRTVTESDESLTKDTGTEFYAAPETKGKKYDFRSDIYSLGLVMIELFSNGYTRYAYLNNTKVREELPEIMEMQFPQFHEIIKKMIPKNPELRLKTSEVHNYVTRNFIELDDLIKHNDMLQEKCTAFEKKIRDLERELKRLKSEN